MNNPIKMLEVWNDAFAAFQGAFDTPVSRRKNNDVYSQDAIARMQEFNKLINTSVVPDQPILTSVQQCVQHETS